MCGHLNLYKTPFFVFVVFALGAHEKGSDSVAAFEVHLDVQVVAGLLEIFPKSFSVGYHDGNASVVGPFIVGDVLLVPSGCLCIAVIVLVVGLSV